MDTENSTKINLNKCYSDFLEMGSELKANQEKLEILQKAYIRLEQENRELRNKIDELQSIQKFINIRDQVGGSDGEYKKRKIEKYYNNLNRQLEKY